MEKCTICGLLKNKSEFLNKPNHRRCKACRNEQTKIWYDKNYERLREKAKNYYLNRDKELILLQAKKSRLKLKYGITLEDYDNLFKEQKGKCAICGKHQNDLNYELNVDHCHTTGKVRGLLCRHCNHGLGKFSDNIERIKNLLEYILKNQ